MGRGGADIHIGKGVFVRFGFDAIRISQIQRQVKNKATRTSHGGVLYTALIGFNRFIGCRQRVFFIYLHWRGAFGVARFDKLGDARASTRGASDRRDSTSFSYVFLTIISQTTQSGVDVF